MQVNNYNNQNFKAIKLSNNSFEHVKKVAMHLQKTGFENLGHKTMYVNNTNEAKFDAISMVRDKSGFYDREFGAIMLPWSKEAYIVADPSYEQFMLPVVKNIDKGAKLNLSL